MNRTKGVLRDPLIVGILFGLIVATAVFNFVDASRTALNLISLHLSENLFKVIAAAFAGGLIGFERESKNRPAGLRTHALVCIGASLVMIIPFGIHTNQLNGNTFDITRLGAQVISGIGFLGAGTIIRNGNSVKGLTTAASLWVSAIIGLTIGAGDYIISISATAIVIFILKVFGTFEHRQTLKNRHMEIVILTNDLKSQIGHVNHVVDKYHMKLKKMEIIDSHDDQHVKIRINVRIPNEIVTEAVVNEFDQVIKVVNR
ncbi:MgtC/SapB family protein [Acidaminobacter sp. JC074]|uniref:MgtC/SapB family protein n=1 Tax=Acidaminobacter sp. JC074 TaxID=2530199 RepID=UPI001F113EC0|nr:MgtC/SapB family protein [Acidaminobacter sp. JC074]MCH4886508.1 MgtC/SapB family protein [Acidaminobacter sp. JC074]